MNRKCLFGGALATAGVAGVANAQEFRFIYSDVVVGAYAYNLGGPAYDFHSGGGAWSTSIEQPGASALSIGAAHLIEMNSFSNDSAGAFALDLIVLFEVTQDAIATASWDYTGDAYGISAAFTIDDITAGTNLLSAYTLEGSTKIRLEEGRQYQLSGFAFATGLVSGNTMNRLTIPATATVSAFVLAGLFATRRRR